MRFIRGWFFFFFLSGIFSLSAQAGLSPTGNQDYSIELPSDWVEWPADFQDLVGSYGRKGTLATFYITARELEAPKTVQDLRWEDLFKPRYDAIDIRSQGDTVIGGEKARYCLYMLKPGEFKTAMEGKLPAKYMNYVLIHRNKLFSITFKDTLDGFSLNYPSFVKAIRSLQFKETEPTAVGGKAVHDL